MQGCPSYAMHSEAMQRLPRFFFAGVTGGSLLEVIQGALQSLTLLRLQSYAWGM
jgi:hypothetical protein